MAERGQKLDLSTDPSQPEKEVGKPFLGVHFSCCSVYGRLYINRHGDAYEGRCPRCLRMLRAEIGPGGTSKRFFTAE